MVTSVDNSLDTWFIHPRPNPNATARLFCFHPAGGNALFFHNWAKELHPSIEPILIQLPRRGSHLGKPLLTRMDPVISYLSKAILEYCNKPYYFFGHSLGALIAFELTHALQKNNKPLPYCLFASGKSPPHLSSNKSTYHLSDRDFIDAVKQYNGLPPEILNENSLMDLFLPVLRADFEILETYVYQDRAPLFCDLIALGGIDDPIVQPNFIKEWQNYTSKSFNYHLLPGDHFFIKAKQDNVLNIIYQEIFATCDVSF